jgi:hypothetical protein
MSKKQGVRKKVTVKVNPGEAVFVASLEVLQHIAGTYSYMASSCDNKEEADSWNAVSEDILSWITDTYYSGQADDFEEEW